MGRYFSEGDIRRVSGGGLYLSALVHTALTSGIKYSRVVGKLPFPSRNLAGPVNGTLGVNLEIVRQSHTPYTRVCVCLGEITG